MEDQKKPLYLVDTVGSVPPEIKRYAEIRVLIGGLLSHSRTISEIVSNLRSVSVSLGEDRMDVQEDGRQHTLLSEAQAREELMKISGYLSGLNGKLWDVSRSLGTECDAIAHRVNTTQDENFAAELETYVKTSPA